MKTPIFFIIIGIVVYGIMSQYMDESARPIAQEDLHESRIHAYRDWQSTGVQLQQGDWVMIEAEGTWLYTPNVYHGPAGSRYSQAPGFYPLPHFPSGSLIGRIDEYGDSFYVGDNTQFKAVTQGVLYLKINDDIVSDNEGWVAVDVTLERTLLGEY
ncbi:MAG: hypothetical protein AAF639_29130 [Chloroflexota bacterium]